MLVCTRALYACMIHDKAILILYIGKQPLKRIPMPAHFRFILLSPVLTDSLKIIHLPARPRPNRAMPTVFLLTTFVEPFVTSLLDLELVAGEDPFTKLWYLK